MPAVHSFRISRKTATSPPSIRFALCYALITSKHPQWLESRLEQPFVWGWGWLEARTTLTNSGHSLSRSCRAEQAIQ